MHARFQPISFVGALLLALVPACGDDGASPTADAANNNADATAPTEDASICATDLLPSADGTALPADLVLSEIAPGMYIELYNSTNNAIDLGTGTHELCSPFSYRALRLLAPQVTVPPHGFALVPYPANFSDSDAGGQVMLYSAGPFDASDKILDFVCWGTRSAGRKSQAEDVGKWTGDCAAALTNGAIHRSMATAGTGAADYDTSSSGSPANCVQP